MNAAPVTMGAERVRRELAERERDELRRQLEALTLPRETPHAPETATEEPEGTERPDPTGDKRRRAYKGALVGGVGSSGLTTGGPGSGELSSPAALSSHTF